VLTPTAARSAGRTALRPLNFPRDGSHRGEGRVTKSRIRLGWERYRAVRRQKGAAITRAQQAHVYAVWERYVDAYIAEIVAGDIPVYDAASQSLVYDNSRWDGDQVEARYPDWLARHHAITPAECTWLKAEVARGRS
jgi:hypothetical protein